MSISKTQAHAVIYDQEKKFKIHVPRDVKASYPLFLYNNFYFFTIIIIIKML